MMVFVDMGRCTSSSRAASHAIGLQQLQLAPRRRKRSQVNGNTVSWHQQHPPRAQRRSARAHGTAEPAPADSAGPSALVYRFTNLFPLWVLAGCLSGLSAPQLYTSWYEPVYVTTMLAITMLCMGFTLSVDDITAVLKTPQRVATGAVLQYTIMPTLGFLISRAPGMPAPFAAGIILLACCPGGCAAAAAAAAAAGVGC
jgi:Sodium Bile acid symporter family